MNIRLYLPALAFVLCSGCATRLQRSTDVARTGQPVPYFSLTLSDSSRVTPDSLLGAPALLIFFNTRCGACRQELPQLQKLYGRIPLRMLAISREEADSSIRRFWQANGLTFPYAAQAGREVYNRFAVRYIPRLYLIDAKGYTRRIFRSSTRNGQIRRAWKKLTRTASPSNSAQNSGPVSR